MLDSCGDHPSVSVIIPMFNSASTVARTLDSVLAQDPPPTEVIAVDDGSPDESGRIAEAYGGVVRCLRQEHAGVSAARNAGVRAARGDLVAFLDPDDYWLPGFLRATIAFLNDYPQTGAVSTSRLVKVRRGNREVLSGVRTLDHLPTGLIDDFFSTIARAPFVWTGSALLRREIANAVGDMRTDLPAGEDLEYWSRIAKRTTWGYVADRLTVYDRTNPHALTHRSSPRRFVRDIDEWKRDLVPLLTEQDLPGFRQLEAGLARRAFSCYLEDADMPRARAVLKSGRMLLPSYANRPFALLASMPGTMAPLVSALWQLSLRVWRIVPRMTGLAARTTRPS